MQYSKPHSVNNNTHSPTILEDEHLTTQEELQAPLQPLTSAPVITEPDTAPLIAIIIDDLGYQWKNGLRSIQLEGDYTLAILPFSPYARQMAQKAAQQGKEVMLHAPMEPISAHTWHEHQGLHNKMNQVEFEHMLSRMLEEVPDAKGINNHMGSALTQNKEIMGWLMEEVSARGLYFVDSRTTPLTKAYSAAQDSQVPSLKRDIFIDNIRTPEAIERQFNKLLKVAHKQGSAIAICHPYPETIAFLERADLKIKQSNSRLVSISDLLSRTGVKTQATPNLPAQRHTLQ